MISLNRRGAGKQQSPGRPRQVLSKGEIRCLEETEPGRPAPVEEAREEAEEKAREVQEAAAAGGAKETLPPGRLANVSAPSAAPLSHTGAAHPARWQDAPSVDSE